MPPKKKRSAPSSSVALHSSSAPTAGPSYWLMKAEPHSRLEKGVDVAFSIDHFESTKDQITSWDGVRNPEARTMMRDKMSLGDNVLFYHSNCKLPGIAGLAKICKTGYPDYTAWDPNHPYFDPKSDRESPKWFMVDVKLERRLPRLVSLALLQHLASSPQHAKGLHYLNQDHLNAILKMQLLNRGRLSVQSVERKAFEAIVLLAENGGWEDWPGKWNPTPGKARGMIIADQETPKPNMKKRIKPDASTDEEPSGRRQRARREKT